MTELRHRTRKFLEALKASKKLGVDGFEPASRGDGGGGFRPGQVLRQWWVKLLAGELTTPQAVYREAMKEEWARDARPSDRFLDAPSDDGHWTAPERLMTSPAYFTGDVYLRQSHRCDWQHCDVRLQRWAALFIEYARKRDIPLYVHCAFRSREDQDRLKADGFSKVWWPKSAHNIGEAVDIVHSVYHWELTSQEWALLRVLGDRALRRINSTLPMAQQMDLNWGGPDGPSDKFAWDPAHWEISDYRSRTREIAAGDPVRRTPRAILAQVKF